MRFLMIILFVSVFWVGGVSMSEDGGGKERWRNWYLYRENLLQPTASQGYSHGKWEKVKPSTTPAGYMFKKVGP
jgi:hypothetical protein